MAYPPHTAAWRARLQVLRTGALALNHATGAPGHGHQAGAERGANRGVARRSCPGLGVAACGLAEFGIGGGHHQKAPSVWNGPDCAACRRWPQPECDETSKTRRETSKNGSEMQPAAMRGGLRTAFEGVRNPSTLP